MISRSLPPHVAARLGKPQLRGDCLATVRAAEAAGLRVRVVRHQLGHVKAPEYNTARVVYETPEGRAR